MTSLLLLIPAALALGLLGLAAFLWALRSGQFEDLEGAASRILFDDEAPEVPRQPEEERKPQTRSCEGESSHARSQHDHHVHRRGPM